MSDTLRRHGKIVLATVGLTATAGVCTAAETTLVSAGSAVCALVAGVFACWIVGAVFAGLVDLLLVVDAGRAGRRRGERQAHVVVDVGTAVAWAVPAAVATFVAGQWDFARHRRSRERRTGS